MPRSRRLLFLALPGALQVLGFLFLLVALARPVVRERLPHQSEGIDILLCLDTSSSMIANDLDPRRTRLEVVRDAAQRFIRERPNDRIGLIGFARYPDVRCPLTLDHRALGEMLTDLSPVPSDSFEDATGIGTAVARSAQVLKESAAPSKVVILFTDGEENVATARTPGEIAPVHAAQLCEALGIRVYAIAAGGGRPDHRGGWTVPDTSQLQDLALRTDGRFFEARDANTLAGVYAHIDELERSEIEEPRFKIEERFSIFLATALALLFLGRLLGSTVLEIRP